MQDMQGSYINQHQIIWNVLALWLDISKENHTSQPVKICRWPEICLQCKILLTVYYDLLHGHWYSINSENCTSKKKEL